MSKNNLYRHKKKKKERLQQSNKILKKMIAAVKVLNSIRKSKQEKRSPRV